MLLQKAMHPSVDSSADNAGGNPCLCVFDVDRTLTGRQGLTATTCPQNEVVHGVRDPAYGGGTLTLSELGAAGLDSTFCSACYLGIVSAGNAGGDGSKEREVLVKRVLSNEPQRKLRQRSSRAQEWCYGHHINSPFVLSQPDRTKQHAVVGIVDWYRALDIHIPAARVHFFGDRTENIGPFRRMGFNAREISCGSRDMNIGHGIVGLCGARVSEIVSDRGVSTCNQRRGGDGGEPSLPALDSSPGRHGVGKPLQACQGDCDGDGDCATGLRCFKRDGYERIPGCSGHGVRDFDYCHVPDGQPNEATPAPATPAPATPAPAWPTPPVAPTPVEPAPSLERPVPLPPVTGPPGASELDSSPGIDAQGKPLQACQGDCDMDSDCSGALQCFQRDDLEPVPGCSGDGLSGFDYCYEPQQPDLEPELDSSPGQHGDGAPLAVCQGDCDSDGDCAGSLQCFHRDALEPVPGCRGAGVPNFDYCYMPEEAVPARGEVPEPVLPVFPLDSSPGQHTWGKRLTLCQGDCDSDQDCAGQLKCHQRNGQDQVPGCTGVGVWNFDYCVHPSLR